MANLHRTAAATRRAVHAVYVPTRVLHAHAPVPFLTQRTAARTVSLFKFAGETQSPAVSVEDLFFKVKSIHESVLKPLNTKLLGPLEKATEEMIPLPMVFVLGNHSSGKSSFINYVIGRQIQATGVAPTDDAFTLVAPGTVDVDQDGPALIGDPNLGFRGLRQFGNGLINHLQLKVRQDLQLPNIMIVDSPGMIDSPTRGTDSSADSLGKNARDRGYDFANVVRWFADRADIILLFQDPAKPGTTGETLNIMTTALNGQDYKTFIILNKADQFSTVHDFARAYGALCWNLSKVIPRKDLPRIYTMCVPVANPTNEGGGAGQSSVLKDAMPDLEATRAEIVAEVKKAPLRRVDNLVTRLYDSARLLKMHAVVLNAVRREYYGEVIKIYGMLAAGATGFGTLAGTLLMTGLWEVGAPLAGVTVAATAAGSWYAQKHLGARADYYIQGPGLDESFRRAHFLQLAEKDDFVVQLWERVRPSLQNCLRTLGIRSAPSAKRAELQALEDVLENDVPSLRKNATKAGAISNSAAFMGTAAAKKVDAVTEVPK